MPFDRSDFSVAAVRFRISYGAHLLDHLAADGAGFTAGQVSIVAILEVNADFGSGFHLELVHSGTGLGDVELVVVLAGHDYYSFSIYFVVAFGYRKHSLAEKEVNMQFSVCQIQVNATLLFILLSILNFMSFALPEYDDFVGEAKACLTHEQRSQVRKLLDFRFKKHPKYNFDRARLKSVEYAVQQRAAELLDE